MSNKLTFKKIENKNIFGDDFKSFNKNNEINFNKNIAILYGPNGTGKTSLSKVLASNNKEKDMCFEVEFKGIEEIEDNDIFYVISDQNSRNIIQGEAKDYLVGDNIAREESLLREIDKGFNDLHSSIKSSLKDIFNITTKNHKLIELISDSDVREYISNFANSKFKIDIIDKDKFIRKINRLNIYESSFDNENEVYQFIIGNFKDNKSIIYQISALKISDIKKNEKVKEIEENNEAIRIMDKFSYKEDECLLCENKDYNREQLLEKKKNNKEKIEKSLDAKTKKILKDIISLVKQSSKDPLNIEKILLDAIHSGYTEEVEALQGEIEMYLQEINKSIFNLLKNSLDSKLVENYDEYKKLIGEQIKISEEDELFLKNVISENIGKEININRDEKNRIRVTLGTDEILGIDRDELGLSTGQQNFISLAFELLKVKKKVDKKDKKYIVLDDPISSFDSIYKNKIAFCIIKFLEGRRQIILTHNTELIKLLEFQNRGCFELYMFNNTPGAENGFININEEEQNLLLKLNKLLDLFRDDIWNYIEVDENPEVYHENKKKFLISMIPFMRGYANIVGNKDVYKNLCKVMHGYESDYIDIGCAYNSLFGGPNEKVIVSVKEILEINLDDDKIIDKEKYPLLNRTLHHTLNYLVLRLMVEQNLCSLDNNKVLNYINKQKEKQGDKYAGETIQQIIDRVFSRNDKSKINERVFFTSRKTLLNEFNHFEGNMNIFQPAIDITDKALKEEKEAIVGALDKLSSNKKEKINVLDIIDGIVKEKDSKEPVLV